MSRRGREREPQIGKFRTTRGQIRRLLVLPGDEVRPDDPAPDPDKLLKEIRAIQGLPTTFNPKRH